MTHYYLHNAQTKEFIMECSKEELDVIKKNYTVTEETTLTQYDGFGNKFELVNTLIII